MPCDDRTGSARKVSWLLILSAGASLAIRRWADAAASARAFCPCVGAAATAPWGTDANSVPIRLAAARPPRCLLLMLSPGSGPKPLQMATPGVGRPSILPVVGEGRSEDSQRGRGGSTRADPHVCALQEHE